jgi:hypothetical protein
MFSVDVYKYDDETYSRMKEVLQLREAFIKDLVKKAIEEDEIKKTTDPQAVTDFIHGMIWWYTFKWRIMNADISIRKMTNDRLKSMISEIIKKE